MLVLLVVEGVCRFLKTKRDKVISASFWLRLEKIQEKSFHWVVWSISACGISPPGQNQRQMWGRKR